MNRINRHCLNILFSELQETDMSYKEMVYVSGFTIWWVIRIIKNLEKQKKVHVCGYYKDALGRETIKIWRWGKGRNVLPNKLTGAEKQRRYKNRLKLKNIPLSLIC